MNLLSSNSLNPQLTLWLIAFSPLTLMLAGCAESNVDSDPNSPGLTGSIEINGSSTGLCIAHALAVELMVGEGFKPSPTFAIDVRYSSLGLERGPNGSGWKGPSRTPRKPRIPFSIAASSISRRLKSGRWEE